MTAAKGRPAIVVLPLAVLGALGACVPPEDRYQDRYQQPWVVLPPVALGTAVAYVETASATAFVVDPAGSELRPRIVPVGKRPALAVRRKGHNELLVLSQGERGEPGAPPEAPSLKVIPADSALPVRSFALGSRFNGLAQSQDGRFVVTYFVAQTSSGGGASDVLFNPNEIAVIDLAAGGDPPAVPRTLRSFGSVPLEVIFSPELTLPFEAGRKLHLAAVLSDGYVTLFDLERGDRVEITIPLTLPDDRRMVRPVQVLFDQQDPTQEPTLFVRAQGANDIYALRLTFSPPAERSEGGNDFRPVLSQLGAGTRPADMALFDTPDGTRLLVVSDGSAEAFVVDARTSRATAIKLDAPASRIVLFDATSPAEPKVRPRALLVGLASAVQVAFLDLDRLEELGRRNLDTRAMGGVAEGLLPFVERGLVIVQHPAGSASSGLSVVDLARRTISPLVSDARSRAVLGPPSADQLWIVPPSGSRLGHLDLARLGAGEVRLDAPVRGVLPLEPGKDGRSHVVVDHPAAGGHLTVLDAEKPERATARSLVGFLFADLFERRVP
jgi:hypothetical protein